MSNPIYNCHDPIKVPLFYRNREEGKAAPSHKEHHPLPDPDLAIKVGTGLLHYYKLDLLAVYKCFEMLVRFENTKLTNKIVSCQKE